MKMYSIYIKNFHHALITLDHICSRNQKVSLLIQQQNKLPECKGLILQSFLIMPVQRIPRYRLLLLDILKKHNENSTADASLDQIFQKALLLASDLANYVNETIRDHEMIEKMVELQKSLVGLTDSLFVPGRRLIKYGKLSKICRKNHQIRLFILFSDSIFYAAPTLLEHQYIFHRKIDLDDCSMDAFQDSEFFVNAIQITSSEKSFICYCDSASEREIWLNTFQKTKHLFLENQSTLRKSEFPPGSHGAKQLGFLAPVWIPDSFADYCLVCRSDFGIINRKVF